MHIIKQISTVNDSVDYVLVEPSMYGKSNGKKSINQSKREQGTYSPPLGSCILTCSWRTVSFAHSLGALLITVLLKAVPPDMMDILVVSPTTVLSNVVLSKIKVSSARVIVCALTGVPLPSFDRCGWKYVNIHTSCKLDTDSNVKPNISEIYKNADKIFLGS